MMTVKRLAGLFFGLYVAFSGAAGQKSKELPASNSLGMSSLDCSCIVGHPDISRTEPRLN
jgi:hypothetical protein